MVTNAEIFANTYMSLQKQRAELAGELDSIGKELAAARQQDDPEANLLKYEQIKELEAEQKEVQGLLKATDERLGDFKELMDQAKALENSENLRPEMTLEERLQLEKAAEDRLNDNRQESEATAVAQHVAVPTPMGDGMAVHEDPAAVLLLAAAVVAMQTAEKVAELMELAKGTLEVLDRRAERAIADQPPQRQEVVDGNELTAASEKEMQERHAKAKEDKQEQKDLQAQLDKLQEKFDQRHADTDPARKAELQAQLDAQFEALKEALATQQREERERLLEEQRKEREDPER